MHELKNIICIHKVHSFQEIHYKQGKTARGAHYRTSL